MAQNLVPDATGDAQRSQLGPEPGAESRRPQWGQNGSSPFARPSQNGQVMASAWLGARAGAETTRVAGIAGPPPGAGWGGAAAAFTPVDLPMGLPQSMQYCAPASFSRPQ